ncbi:DNA adenine methylase [Aggregatibacter segnis]|uniref:DNA adenine methylase n=1 Tax=Aggregatibacter segnis TaxID=739 RepID=UPI000D695CA1|nr:DNA adenine methylase [Aggregatibacter segnis]
MRFLGNKESIVDEIRSFLDHQGLLNQDYTFFDAFCGTGTVSDYLKNDFNLILNDSLNWCTHYAKGRILEKKKLFNKLGFNPIVFFNESNELREGFFYNNYSPKAKRMYFTEENAGKIDFFREKIEEWYISHQINENEYSYLLASLLESVSKVANVAGVYGAFLKKWDSRALKKIEFLPVNSYEGISKKFTIFNQKVEDIISKVECDILYLDPPYTQNQYGTQYHLLETLILNDNPPISKITGSRPTGPMRSSWSKDLCAHILLDKIIFETKAKYILFSYSSDGIMSKSFIEACLKRYGKTRSFQCKNINYKKYTNHKSKNKEGHYEYLFFIEKEDLVNIRYESPLNYIGSKYKIIKEIKERIKPTKNFIDVFAGGFNVGINISSNEIIFNDINHKVVELVRSFYQYNTYDYIMFVRKNIKKFKLQAGDKESYLKIREHYNSLPECNKDPRLLYTIILYGFNQQIRFNGNLEFNNPTGMRWFNDKVLEKLISFSRHIKTLNIKFLNYDFCEFSKFISTENFYYMDPPYMLTLGSYNDGKRGFSGWTKIHECALFDFADEIHNHGAYFMMSYVSEHKEKCNNELISWINKNNYNLIELPYISGKNRKEILITNYNGL